ncbi:hydroxyproline dehydrogenase-like [Macrobrachium nipponense]|uniref:hydroxyproline dehydrogenase-like n=1 Tax=Macrobrachium nipponense TaxID=159736 RepID=UPI0030C86372
MFGRTHFFFRGVVLGRSAVTPQWRSAGASRTDRIEHQARLAQTSSFAGQAASHRHMSTVKMEDVNSVPSGQSAWKLDFSSHSFAFKHKKTKELIRGLLVLNACAVDTLVNHSIRLLTLGERILGEKLLSIFVAPFYNQFVAGNSEDKLAAISRSLHEVNVKLMVAPMLETDIGEGHDLEAMYRKNLDKTLFLIEMARRHNLSRHSTPICQTKHTAHLSADVLAKISTAYMSLSEEKRAEAVRGLALLMEASGKDGFREGTLPEVSSPLELLRLDIDDYQQLMESLPRLYILGEKCVKENVILAVDAEFTYTNPAINFLTLAMMKVFNTGRKPLIWNTYQGYLKSGLQNLQHDLRLARALGNVGFGVKIVRGAYLERERSDALEQGHPDPVNDTYEDTCSMYNSMVDAMLQEVQKDPEGKAIVVATHNEESVLLAASKMEELGLDPTVGNVVFGQVYGMAENITLPLAHCGYLVYKSVPYGSMLEVMPYLSRRASENRAVLRGARKERQLLSQELRSRFSFST